MNNLAKGTMFVMQNKWVIASALIIGGYIALKIISWLFWPVVIIWLAYLVAERYLGGDHE